MYAALVVRNYGEGRICIHTDRMGAIQTGHRDNPKLFWRRIFEYVTGKKSNEIIRVGLIVSSPNASPDRISSLKPISVIKLDLSDLAIMNLDEFDCLYFAGLPVAITPDITSKIEVFVRDGGGLIIESPDRGGEYINVLTGIENVYCTSSEKPMDTYAYWTQAGSNSYVFYNAVSVAFMTALKEEDFSSDWAVLMNDVPTTVTSTTAPSAQSLNFGGRGVFEFGVGFTSAMQNGFVTLETGEESSSSSSDSSSSSTSLSSSSSSSTSSSSSSSDSSSSSTSLSSSSSSSSSDSSSSSTSLSSSSSSSTSSSSSSTSSSTEIRSSSSSFGGFEKYTVDWTSIPGTPDGTGTYVVNGYYGGKPAYERLDGAYWLWWEQYGGKWSISVNKGDIYMWGAFGPIPETPYEGVYSHSGSATQDVTVTLAI